MKARKLTLRKEMLLGLSLLLILAGLFELAGHLQMRTLSRDTNYVRQLNRCERLFDAVDWTNPVDPKTGKASANWQKARDNFLASVDTLAQTPSLTQNDKNLVKNIRLAWQGYEFSLPHQTVPGMLAVRSVVKNTIHQASIAAGTAASKGIATADFRLRVAVLLGSLLGVGIVLLIARSIRRRLDEVRQQLNAVSQSTPTQPQTVSQDDLKLQAEQLVNAVAELNNFIGQSLAQTQKAAAEEKQTQDENVTVH